MNCSEDFIITAEHVVASLSLDWWDKSETKRQKQNLTVHGLASFFLFGKNV